MRTHGSAYPRETRPHGMLLPPVAVLAVLLFVSASCKKQDHPVTIEPGSPLAMSATDAVDRIHTAMSRGFAPQPYSFARRRRVWSTFFNWFCP
jgi:hypothetical protein